MNKNLYTKFIYIFALGYSFVAILVALNSFSPLIQKYYFAFAFLNEHSTRYVLDHIPNIYNKHTILIYTHILFGSLMILIWPFQFSTKLRIKMKRLHIKLGYIFFISSIFVGITSLLLGFLTPFAGYMEAIVNFMVVGAFFYCLYKSFNSIKNKKINEHKRWIIKVLALALGIITQRTLFTFEFFFRPELSSDQLFVLSAFFGFFGNLLLAELGIRWLKI